MVKYRAIKEYERLHKEIEAIRTKKQIEVVRQMVTKAEENDRISHAEHQILLGNLRRKDEEIRMYRENVREKEE